jgi:outer membrane protein assembly factor BamB
MAAAVSEHERSWSAALAGVALVLLAAQLIALDWPQHLGPERNGVYRGAALSESWPAGGPRIVWRKTVGEGFAAPVVAENRLFVFHRIGGNEILDALDPATGTALWRYQYPTEYRDDFGFDEGPRAAPVVAENTVFTFGAEGQLHAINAADGKRRWSEDTMQRFTVPKGFFGAAGSPIVEEGRVIANVGGSMDGSFPGKVGIVAFDAKTGKVLWTSTTEAASYSSGITATLGGSRHAIFLTRNSLIGLDPATGAVKFSRRWQARQASSVNAATPIVVGDDLLFVSAEYGPGAAVLRVEGSNLTPLWASDDVLSNHYATSVYSDGVLYGYHGRQEYGPSLRAVDMRTGKVRWNQEQFRAGSITLLASPQSPAKLLIVRESGELIIAAASPEAFTPIARAQVLPGIVRSYPAISDGFVYLRSGNTLACLDLRR